MKRIVSMLFVALFLLSNIALFAIDGLNVNNVTSIQPRIIGPCAIHGVHQMHLKDSNGVFIKNRSSGEIVLYNPLWYKCACGEEAFTSGKPHYAGWDVGYYITSGGFNRMIDNNGVWLFVTDYSSTTIRYARSLRGYTFHSDY